MNRKSIVVIGSAVMLALASMAPAMAQTSTPAPTQEPQPTQAPMMAATTLYATADFRSNVRSGPGRQYTVLGQVRQNDALDVTGQLADGTWLRINYNGQEGWILASLFEVTGDLTTVPEAEAGASAVLRQTASQSNAVQLGTVVVRTNGNVNLRTAPSTDADVVVIIPFETTLTVLGKTANNNWVRVSFNDQTGWLSSGVLFFAQGNIANVAVVDDAGNTVQPTAAPTAAPAATATTSP